jgi:hypothetical protein
MGFNAFSVDEFVGTVSQGRRSSPAGADASRGLMDLNSVGIRKPERRQARHSCSIQNQTMF